MASTVTTRPNHYEVLGLTPSASSDDINAAFAREIGRPRAFGGLLDVSVAFEALRDPARRRNYDSSIGLNVPKAEPLVGLDRFSMTLPAIHLGPPARLDAPPQLEARTKPVAEPDAGSKIALFIASAVRGTVAPRHDAPPVSAMPDRPPASRLTAGPMRAEDSEQMPIDVKRPAVIVGGLVAAVALIGAWAGVTAGNEAESSQPERAVTVALPRAKAPEAVEPASREAAIEPLRTVRPVLAARPARRAPAAQPPSALTALASETFAAAPANGEADPLAPSSATGSADETAVEATPASLPLSNATVASTIGRIGYACNAVASTQSIGGGAFKVTCTSGQSFRAAPVHGRYRFKRL